jgi:hypothetical protein
VVQSGADPCGLVVVVLVDKTVADIVLALLVFLDHRGIYACKLLPHFFVIGKGSDGMEINTEIEMAVILHRSSLFYSRG